MRDVRDAAARGITAQWYTPSLMTIVRRNGRFGVKVWDPGAKRYRWIGSYSTETEARQAETDAALSPRDASPTVAQWGKIWLSDYAREAPATRQVYRQAVKAVTAALGSITLDCVDRPTARRLAVSWPRNTSAVARTMWADAVRDGYTRENPWTNMRLKQSRGRRDIKALTELQVQELAQTAQAVHAEFGAEAAAIILTLAYTGIRPGELAGLRWEDIDLPEREIHVRRSIDATGHQKLPKNGRTRLITVPPAAADVLDVLPRSLDGYVFHTVRGRPFSKPTLWYMWRPITAAWRTAGHDDLDLYELRHAAATMLLERGVAHADVAVQLGHTDGGALVMERYGHPSHEMSRERLKMAWGTELQSEGADGATPRRSIGST